MKNTYHSKAFSLIELSIVILIIGLLFAGIVKGQQLFKKTKLATIEKFVKESPVKIMPGLSVCLETTMEGSIDSNLVDLDHVSTWFDKKPQTFGSPNNTVQSNDISKPRLIKESFNNLIDGVGFFHPNYGISVTSRDCLDIKNVNKFPNGLTGTFISIQQENTETVANGFAFAEGGGNENVIKPLGSGLNSISYNLSAKYGQPQIIAQKVSGASNKVYVDGEAGTSENGASLNHMLI